MRATHDAVDPKGYRGSALEVVTDGILSAGQEEAIFQQHRMTYQLGMNCKRKLAPR